MSDEHHTWHLNSPPPLIRPHSIAKHRVIEQYLRLYVDTLTANVRIPELRLTLVDGFAGGGLYRDSVTREERYGSPLIMLRAMRESAAVAQCKRSKDFLLEAEYIFIESRKETFDCLCGVLQASEFRDQLDDRIQLVNGLFINQVDAIIERVQGRARGDRAIFLLDQFGYKDVPFSAIRSILARLNNAEIILTFATDTLIDYISGQEPMQRALENIGLQITNDEIQLAKQRRDWRRVIQFLLHEEIYKRSGAQHYTPFFIRSKDAHRDYWLIHLSNHSRARDVMVGLHWLEKSTFAHYGGEGLMMLGYNQDHDFDVTRQNLLLPEYHFDEVARKATDDRLLEQLPARLYTYPDGVAFKQLFSEITNETPATSEIIKATLTTFLQEGIIDIRDKTGLVKRQNGIQRHTDVIIPSKQRHLFLQ